MTAFLPTRCQNPCPICTDTSGKCRETSHVYLCMTMADGRQHIPGFRFIGRTKDNLWGKWLTHHRDQKKPSANTQEYLKNRQCFKRSPSTGIPSATERDRLYRNLLETLTLDPIDRDDLNKRGVTDEQIQRWGVKSVNQWHLLADLGSPTLAGVHSNGRTLNTPYAGYLCPIRDVEGHIVACQIRTRQPNEDTPKYYWLTSKTKRTPNGATPHLTKGELPLSVHRPQNPQRQAIALVEGTGAKPYLTAEKRQIITIGAAGGQFASSPHTLQATLETLFNHKKYKHPDQVEAQNNTPIVRRIEFYPDAGAVSNPHVLRQYRETWMLLRRLGFTVQIMWWNQLTKASPDIDELSELNQIQAITIEDFETIAHQPKHLLQQLSTLFRLEKRKSKSTQPSVKNQSNHSIHYYRSGERTNTWKTAIDDGYQYILDSSPTGMGKSFDTGNLDPLEIDGVRGVIYLSDQHRNPTVPTLSSKSGWMDLEARHAGLITEPSSTRSTRTRRAHKGELPHTHANCSRTQTIEALQTKHIPGAGTASLICGACPLKEICTQAVGNGYGFLFQRRTALSSLKFRAHPNSMPDPDDYPYDERLLVWDEPGQTFAVRKDIHVTLSDLEQAIATLLKDETTFDTLKPLLSALIPYLDGSVQTGKFGISHQDVVNIFPSLEHINLQNIDQLLTPNLDFLTTNTSEITHEIGRSDTTTSQLSTVQQDEAIAHIAEKKIPKKWIPALIQILNNQWKGSLSIRQNMLTVSLFDPRHRTLVKSAKATIFLDATLSKFDLALKLGCTEGEIYEVQQYHQETPQNLTLLQVTDLGRMGMQRGNQQHQRAKALIDHYKTLDPTTKVIDFKKYSIDGAWWRDNRGINDFNQTKTLILVGTPCRNLIDQISEYGLITGDHNIDSIGFQSYVSRTIQADIIQAIGRLRAHRRKEEQLLIVYVSNFDISLETKKTIASEITVYAASKQEKFIQASLNAFQTLKKQQQKITQTAVSKLTGYSQQYLSRFWKLLLMLLEEINRKSSNLSEENQASSYSEIDIKLDKTDVHFTSMKRPMTIRMYANHLAKLLSIPLSETNCRCLGSILTTYRQRKTLLMMLSCLSMS